MARDVASMLEEVAADMARLVAPPDRPRPVVLPAYGAMRAGPNLTALVALMLKRFGVAVLIHGRTDGAAGGAPGVTTAEVLRELSIAPAATLAEAQAQLARESFAFVPVGSCRRASRDAWRRVILRRATRSRLRLPRRSTLSAARVFASSARPGRSPRAGCGKSSRRRAPTRCSSKTRAANRSRTRRARGRRRSPAASRPRLPTTAARPLHCRPRTHARRPRGFATCSKARFPCPTPSSPRSAPASTARAAPARRADRRPGCRRLCHHGGPARAGRPPRAFLSMRRRQR
jgi:hypothetical protein